MILAQMVQWSAEQAYKISPMRGIKRLKEILLKTKFPLTVHTEYTKSYGKSYPINTFDSIEAVLAEGSLESFYPAVVSEFYKAYKTKSKDEIQELNQDYSSKEVIDRATSAAFNAWQRISSLGVKKDPKVFAERIGNLYIRFEKTNDRLWKASNGYDKMPMIENETDFLQTISRHVYATTIFESRGNIKEIEKPDGTITRPSQRSLKHVRGVLPIAIYDIDDGLSISQAKNMIDKRGCSYAIVTTKSHGFGEGDRYRVFIPLTFGEKFKDFAEKGLMFEREESIRRMQMKEWNFMIVEVARSLGILEFCDPAALGDASRKYMPSPPPGADNHVSVIELNREPFQLQTVIAAAKQAKERHETEAIERRRAMIEKYSSCTNMHEMAEKNPNWRVLFDTDIVNMTDPAEIIYHYELTRLEEDGANCDPEDVEEVKVINFYGSNPRIKVKGHEYAVWQPADAKGYLIRDFVAGTTTNLMGYLRDRFDYLDFSERLFKLKSDFSDLFGKDLIKENPYYYLQKLTEVISEVGTEQQKINTKLAEMKIANAVYFDKGKFIVKKTNGYSLQFSILREGEGVYIKQGGSALQKYLSAVQNKSAEMTENHKNFSKKETQMTPKNTI